MTGDLVGPLLQYAPPAVVTVVLLGGLWLAWRRSRRDDRQTAFTQMLALVDRLTDQRDHYFDLSSSLARDNARLRDENAQLRGHVAYHHPDNDEDEGHQ